MSENLEQVSDAHTANQTTENCRQEASCPCGGEPDKCELGAFGGWFRHHRLSAIDLVMERRSPAAVELGFAIGIVDHFSVSVSNRPVRRGVDVHIVLHRLKAPEENEHGKNQEWRPGLECPSGRILMDRRCRAAGNAGNGALARWNHGHRPAIFFKAPYL